MLTLVDLLLLVTDHESDQISVKFSPLDFPTTAKEPLFDPLVDSVPSDVSLNFIVDPTPLVKLSDFLDPAGSYD